jgi:hypothetical protein
MLPNGKSEVFMSDNRIHVNDIGKILREVHQIHKPEQHALIKGMLSQHAVGGYVSEAKIDKVMRKLKTDSADGITRLEADRVQEALHQELHDEE